MRTSPPYQIKTSQATRSFVASSQDNAFVARRMLTPSKATVVVWMPWSAEVPHTAHTRMKTESAIFSSRFRGPIASSSFRAISAA